MNLYNIVKEIFPIYRSITGNGVEQTLEILKKYCSELEIKRVKSGTRVFDWVVPREWNITAAYIEDEDNNRIIDFLDNNLHIVGYSAPLDIWVEGKDLKNYIFYEEKQPDCIPYITSYYREMSGFCMSKNMYDALDLTKRYHLVIDSEYDEEGNLTYGEIFLPGKTKKEVLITSYVCHPSMANNECSGPAVVIGLADQVSKMKNRKYSYRFVLAPETNGAITFISQNLENLKNNVVAGYILTCVGDNKEYSIVKSRYGNNISERILENILKNEKEHYKAYSYMERGSDERQYCSPLVNLPMCTFCRTKFFEYPEYHTSADDLDFVSEEGLQGAYDVIMSCIDILESNNKYIATTYCEPQLGKRNLYPTLSRKGTKVMADSEELLDVFSYSDGKNDLISISEITGISIVKVAKIVELLKNNELLEEIV